MYWPSTVQADTFLTNSNAALITCNVGRPSAVVLRFGTLATIRVVLRDLGSGPMLSYMRCRQTNITKMAAVDLVHY